MDSVHLIGSEDVRRGGGAIQSAMESFANNVGWMEGHLERHRMSFSQDVDRLVSAMELLTAAFDRLTEATKGGKP